jgi:WD40-like Beta Propeller Repeat
MWISGINGEAPLMLVPAEKQQRLSKSVWSPDGHWVAYWRRRRSKDGKPFATIEIIHPVAGGSAKTLVSEADMPKSSTLSCGFWAQDKCLSWAPDWRLLFALPENSVSASSETRVNLWQVRVDPGSGRPAKKPQRLFQWSDLGPAGMNGPDTMTISADGKTLAFVKRRIHQDVYIGELDRGGTALGTPRRFTLDNHDSDPEAWSPDSRSIFFDSNRSGKSEVFRQGLTESVPERVGSAVSGNVGSDATASLTPAGSLSPDASWILYWDNSESGSARLMRLPVAGGPPEVVVEIPAPLGAKSSFSCPRKAGTSCVLAQPDGKNLVFYNLDPLHGKGTLLSKIEVETTEEFYGWQVSPDGLQLAVVDWNHSGIEIMTLPARTWHEIAMERGWGHNQCVAWAADAKGFTLR